MLPELNKIHIGDCIEVMKTWPADFVQTVVTSPPYWGLRDYGVEGQIGLEGSPEAFVEKMVEVFREVRRILRPDGTLWMNLGDSYYNYRPGEQAYNAQTLSKNNRRSMPETCAKRGSLIEGLKEKDLVGAPWRSALALQADGWYLRSDIIWAKPNPMPESVTDRPTKAHEYLFLLAKSDRYYYDAESIKEKSLDPIGTHRGGSLVNAAVNGNGDPFVSAQNHSGGIESILSTGLRNKRSVWTVATQPYAEAHFATFPPDLIKPCILAGSPTYRIDCTKCGFVIEYGYGTKAHDQDLQALRGQIPSGRQMAEDKAVLQESPQLAMDCEASEDDKRILHHIEGVQADLSSKAPISEQSRVCDGTSARHGKSVGEDFVTIGSGESSQLDQTGQPTRKSRSPKQENSRPLTKTTHQANKVSTLRRPDKNLRPCPKCGSPSELNIPVIFDPFMGAGTTALVSSQYNRRWIGTELNPEYAVLANKRIAGEVAQLKMF